MILTTEDLFLQGPYLLLTARKTCQETQTWALLCKHCIFPNFETLPLHFIPRHPSPTQHLPRYLRVTSFLFVSCRSLTSSLHTPLSSSLGITLLPGFQPSHGDFTSPLYTTVTASAPRQSRPSARAGTGYVLKPPPARRDC